MSNKKYDFNWKEAIIQNESLIELQPSDKLNRARLAAFLTNNVIPDAGLNGYVLNLNAQWGAGKTFFVKRWANSLSEHGHPTVYIDAWKQDYSNDPMLTVIASIIDQLRSYLDTPDKYINKIAEKTWRFFKATGSEVTKGIVKKVSGIDIDNISDELDASNTELPKQDDEDNTFNGSVASKLTAALIDDHNVKLASVEGLKYELGAWAEAIISKGHNGKLNAPVFIFIDELDRCRPNYAVEMLEVIKHFFKIKNLVFVVSTDTEQLQHTVKSVYGESFDAQTYLHRFFDSRYSLNSSSLEQFIISKTELLLSNDDSFSTLRTWPIVNTQEPLTALLTNLANGFLLSLRDTEQLINRLFSIIRNFPPYQELNLSYLVVLLIIREKNLNLYNEVISRSIVSHEKNDILLDFEHSKLNFEVYLALQNEGSRRHYSIPVLSNSPEYRDYGYTFSVSELLEISCNTSLLTDQVQLHEREKALSERINNLSDNSNSYNNWTNAAKLKAEKQMLSSKVKHSTYKDWVEMAIAFDN
ncbi:P-loop NTPase fold protein [uncultured Aliivibrio sp.]|uniref:KAP family P-loop NTPase fold protein n=1 Tax=uncultured Aliivibrio sp. TaxID=873085 RepID=UPI00262BC5D1|nr:P-loop NTPase fold protein [uncultured Aliivibrio sp.]